MKIAGLTTISPSDHALYLEAWRAGMKAFTSPGDRETKLAAVRSALKRFPERVRRDLAPEATPETEADGLTLPLGNEP